VKSWARKQSSGGGGEKKNSLSLKKKGPALSKSGTFVKKKPGSGEKTVKKLTGGEKKRGSQARKFLRTGQREGKRGRLRKEKGGPKKGGEVVIYPQKRTARKRKFVARETLRKESFVRKIHLRKIADLEAPGGGGERRP